MTTTIGSLAVSLSLDSSSFNGSIDRVNRNLGAMGSELRASKALGAEYGKSVEGLTSRKDILSRSVGASTIKLEAERRKYDELVASGTANEATLERQARRVNEAQTQHNRLSTELGQVTEALRIQSSQWTQVGERMQAVGGRLTSVGDKMTSVGKSLSMKVTAPLTAMGGAAFKAAVDFESAFAGVRKTVDGTEAEFQVLSDGIRDMAKEIPAAATEIAGVAEAAGQLGIQKESILGFTRTMTDLGVATNMSSEEAATALARLANITGMNQKDFDRLGSSVVALGNNFATTEKEIVEMGLRLAGAGAQVGMSEADILGLSTALTSVGINAEMGGSAFSRVMVSMQLATSTGFTKVQKLSNETGLSLRDLQMMASHSGKAFGNMAEDMGMTKKELTAIVKAGVELEGFSKIAGMTGEQFKQAFEKDAVGAIGSFIDGLANAEDSGDTAINMLQEMGITSVLLRDSLLRAGGASELFGSAIKVSNAGWDENNALTKEAEERYKTTASQIKILWNEIKDLGMEFGGVLIPVVKDGINAIKPWISSLAQASDGTKKTVLAIGALAAAAGPLLVIGGTLMSGLGGLITTVGALSGAIGVAGGASVVFGSALAVITGPIGLTIAAVAGLGIAVALVAKDLREDAIPEVDRFGESVSESTKKALGSYFELSDGVSQSMADLSITSGTVTEEIKNSMVAQFDEMNNQILAGMETKHAEQIEESRSFFANSNVLSDDQEARILERQVNSSAKQKAEQQDREDRFNAIIEKAYQEKRELTTIEEAAINGIKEEMNRAAVKNLSDSEIEQKIILERMALAAGDLSARQAAEVVENSAQQRDKTIKAAEEQYDQSLGFIIRQRDESHEITKEQADQMIAEAGKSRDSTVAHAKGMHTEVVSEAKKQAKEHVNEVDWETGQIKSKWDVLWGDLKKGWNDYTSYLTGTNMKQIGVDLMTGLKNGIDSMGGAIIKSMKDVSGWITKTIKTDQQVKSPGRKMMAIGVNLGEGLAIGISSTKSLNEKAISEVSNIITDVAKKNASEIGNIASNAEKERTAIQKDSASKIEEIERKSAQNVETIQKTSVNKKGALTASGTQRLLNDKRDTAAKIAKIEEDEKTKLAKINDKAWADMQKKEQEVSNERLNSIKKFISDKKAAEEISLNDEAEIWKLSVKYFKDGTEEKRIAQLALRDARRAVDKEMLESGIAYIDEKKRLGQISLQDEIKMLDELSTHFAEHSTKFETIQKRKAQVVKQVNDDVTKINETFSTKMVDINKKMSDGILKINEETASKTKSINERFIADQLRLNDEYAKAVDGKYKSLFNSTGLFEKLDMSPKQSGDELLGNLKSQVDGFKSWEEEIGKLSNKAIDEGLLAELREMGPKALPQLLALNSMTEEQLSDYSDMYQEKSALARASAEKELKGMKEDTQRRLQELRAVADAELAQLRNDANIRIMEMRFAANEQLAVLQTEWVTQINNITKATDEEFKSLTQVGINAGQNLLNGLASMESSLVDKARAIALAVNAALQSTLGGSGTVNVNGSSGSSGNSKATSSTTNNSPVYNVSIDAKNVKEFNDVVKLVKGIPQVSRAY